MRKCPRCSRLYDDDNLRFCLDDGSALTSTAAIRPTVRAVRPAAPTEVLPAPKSSTEPAKSLVPWAVAAAAILIAAVAVIASLSMLIFVRKPATGVSNPIGSRSPSASPKTSPTIVNLADTRWTDSNTNLAIRSYHFNPGGTINDTSKDTWKQNGNTVILEFNDGYARYEGIINGNQIDYKARNKVNFEWSAKLIRDQ